MYVKKPFGSWTSPINVEDMLSFKAIPAETHFDRETLYWLEMRPDEEGRQAIVRADEHGSTMDVIPPQFNARSRVHEHGGGAFTVHAGTVYFVNFSDQQIYRVDEGADLPSLITKGSVRYSSIVVDPVRNRLIAIAERHSSRGIDNFIATIDLSGQLPVKPKKLLGGHDFFASPKLSCNGKWLAWICWDHPNMPWDATLLMAARLGASGKPGKIYQIAGNGQESVLQPSWSPSGETLYFVSDRTNWWNIYAVTGFNGSRQPRLTAAQNIAPIDGEFAWPMLVLDSPTYTVLPSGGIVAAYNKLGLWSLCLIHPQLATGRHVVSDLQCPFTDLMYMAASESGSVAMVAGSFEAPKIVTILDPVNGFFERIERTGATSMDPGYISIPERIEFPTHGADVAYGFYYAPRNKDFKGEGGELPPLIVKCHGGPTASASSSLNLAIQYWTSRGFAVLDVNYRGSTGFGRTFRDAIKGSWGVSDRIDCENAALYLASKKLVDGQRLAITGSSAGGYTTLCALIFGSVFRAGASHYGISDLEALSWSTNKFASHYLDSLIGPYPACRKKYRKRSPVWNLKSCSSPVLILQGLEDRIVPPDQAQRIVEALKRLRLSVAYLPFEGEQHGFRQAVNIKRAIEAELYFFSRIFGISRADRVEPVVIENLAYE